MKFNLLCTTLALIAMFVFAPQAKALPTTATTTTAPTEIQEKTFTEKFTNYIETRKQLRNERIMKVILKAKTFSSKLAQKIDLQDDTMKWLWYAVFAYGASVILWFVSWAVSFVGWISALASLLGTVCLVIWLIKYLELS